MTFSHRAKADSRAINFHSMPPTWQSRLHMRILRLVGKSRRMSSKRNGFHVARTCFQYEVSTTNPAVLYRNPTVNIYVVLQMTDLHLTTFCWSPNHISYDRKPEYRKVAVLEAHKKTKNQHKIFLIKTKRQRKNESCTISFSSLLIGIGCRG